MKLILDLLVIVAPFAAAAQDKPKELFSRDNLVAWCIVPFDAAKRTPRQRCEMLQRLGLRKVAYDWRDEHIPQWDEELLQYKTHNIELVGFWAPNRHAEILGLLKRHGVKTQLWLYYTPRGTTDVERLEDAVRYYTPLALQAQESNCTVGLYNHGGWSGEPKNLVAIVERLKKAGHANVGIVYNLHHARNEIDQLGPNLRLMLPHLYCLNLNGVKKSGPQNVIIGQGDDDAAVLRTIRASGYAGPIGILDHDMATDSEKTLSQNLAGLDRVAR